MMKNHSTAWSLALVAFSLITNWYWSRTSERDLGDLPATTTLTIDGGVITAFLFAILLLFLVRSTYCAIRTCLDRGLRVPASERVFHISSLWPAIFAIPVLLQVRMTVTKSRSDEIFYESSKGYGSEASSLLLIMTVLCVFAIQFRAAWGRQTEKALAEPGAGGNAIHAPGEE